MPTTFLHPPPLPDFQTFLRPFWLWAPKPRGTKEKKTVTKDFSFVTLQLRRQFHSNSLRKKTRFTLLQSWSDWETQWVDLFSETAFLIRICYTYLFHIEGKIILHAFYLLKTKIMKKNLFQKRFEPMMGDVACKSRKWMSELCCLKASVVRYAKRSLSKRVSISQCEL